MYFTTYQQLLEYAEFEKLLDSLAAVAAKGHGHGADSLYGAVSKIHGPGFARCSLAGKSNCNQKNSTQHAHLPFTTILSSSFLTSASQLHNKSKCSFVFPPFHCKLYNVHETARQGKGNLQSAWTNFSSRS